MPATIAENRWSTKEQAETKEKGLCSENRVYIYHHRTKQKQIAMN
jgi:hypothetical protein